MSFCILKSVFLPSNDFLIDNKNSIESLFYIINNNTIKRNKIKNIIFFGFAFSNKNKNKIIDFINSCNINNLKIIYIFNDLNYGKCYYLKFLSNNYFYDDTHYFFLDHDIILQNFDYFNSSIAFKYFNFISFEQINDCRHQPNSYYSYFDLNNINYCIPSHNISIACGAFLIDNKFFFKLKELIVESIYGLEEYYIYLVAKKYNFKYCLCIDNKVSHPFSKKVKFIKRKKFLLDSLANNKNNNYGFDYDNLVKQDYNFWIYYSRYCD